MKLSALAYAKINLFLKVTGKRNDGLHDLDMIMQSISLADKVIIEETDCGGIKVICDSNIIDDNIAETAALEYFKRANISAQNIQIRIEKNIPVSAGLAGGSTDAAAVLFLLNRMYSKLTENELVNLAGEIGADVPFCLVGGTARVKGFGDIIEKLDLPNNYHLVLVKSGIKKSTGYMYSLIDGLGETADVSADDLLERIHTDDIRGFQFMHNDFMQFWDDTVSVDIQKDLLNFGANAVSLSGSGPTFFGVFDNAETAKKCCNSLKNKYENVYLCQPKCCGIEIIE